MAWASGWPALSPGLEARRARGRGGRLPALRELFAAALLFDPESSHEMGDALAEPGAGRLCIQAWVRAWARTPLSCVGRGRANGGDEQRAGFKGRVFGVGQVEDGELGAGRLAEPALQKGRDGGGGRGPGLRRRRRLRGESRAWCWWLAWGVADGDKEAGRFEAESCAVEAGGGDAGDFGAAGSRAR